MAGTNYIIGDTIRFKAVIRDYSGEEQAPASITVAVYKLDGTEVRSADTPNLIDGTTAQYYYDWTVSTGITIDTRLAIVWNWSGPHKKKMLFNVIPIL